MKTNKAVIELTEKISEMEMAIKASPDSFDLQKLEDLCSAASDLKDTIDDLIDNQ